MKWVNFFLSNSEMCTAIIPSGNIICITFLNKLKEETSLSHYHVALCCSPLGSPPTQSSLHSLVIVDMSRAEKGCGWAYWSRYRTHQLFTELFTPNIKVNTRLISFPTLSVPGLKMTTITILQITNKEKRVHAHCVLDSLSAQPLICECSAGDLLECCQRLLAVICVWLRVSSVRMCVLSVFLSAAAAGTHASPPHHDTHQALLSCSPDLLLTFPPSSPPPTLRYTHITLSRIHVFPF